MASSIFLVLAISWSNSGSHMAPSIVVVLLFLGWCREIPNKNRI
jgi:hypothetical protein